MTNERDIAAEVKGIIMRAFDVDESDIEPPSGVYLSDLGDSLELAELGLVVEVEFGVDFSEEVMLRIRTVQDAIDYIEANVREAD